MRLIDADALLKALNDYGLSYRADINGMIMQAPTIEPSGDLISRADAIDAVMAEGRKVYTSEYANAERIIHEADAVETLSMLPSANAVDGKWLKVEPFEYVYKCSECGHEPVYEGDILKMHFCPNCGARMDAERREP